MASMNPSPSSALVSISRILKNKNKKLSHIIIEETILIRKKFTAITDIHDMKQTVKKK